MIEYITIIILALIFFGPHIRIYDKQSRVLFKYDSIIIRLIQNLRNRNEESD